MNRRLKRNTSKLCQETNLTWDKIFSVALLQISGSQKQLKLSSFETVYGRALQVPAGWENL